MNDLSRKWRCKYTCDDRFGNIHHQWSAVGAKGGVHLTITDMGEEHGQKYGSRYSAGLETHWRSPPEYMADQPPSHDECWLLRQPCWHDGTSLYAQETLVPQWLVDPSIEGMFFLIRYEAERQFNED